MHLPLKLKSLGLLACALLLAACNGNHYYSADGTCWTCLNNPITGEPLNHDDESATLEGWKARKAGEQQAAAEKRQKVTLKANVPMNVDLAYVKIKREFGFSSREELISSPYTSDRIKMGDSAWAYEAVPGVYYKMGDSYSWGVARTELEKTGDNSTLLTLDYRQGSSTKMTQEEFRAAMIKKLKKALDNRITFQ